MKDLSIENIEARLEQLTILELRQTARLVGVDCPAAGEKSVVREKIIAIAKGIDAPVAHPKSPLEDCVDKKLVKDILAYRKSVIGK